VRTRDISRAPVLPSGQPDTVGASNFGYFGAHIFGIPSLHVPLSKLPCAPIRWLCLVVFQRFKYALSVRPRMARGQDGFATPFLYDSFIHYFTPVYPDAIQA